MKLGRPRKGSREADGNKCPSCPLRRSLWVESGGRRLLDPERRRQREAFQGGGHDGQDAQHPTGGELNSAIANGVVRIHSDHAGRGPATAPAFFRHSDFENVHRCGVLAAEARAAQRKYDNIESAAAHLHGMLEGIAAAKSR
jgi:hypothetical protein